YFADADELDRIEGNGQVAFRYATSDAVGPTNPNGASRDIAGVLSNNGRVLGMMPHPERAMSKLHGGTDGAKFLLKSLEALVS
ncbi:phosphoribosylformylglycinamidine synthase subunit PurQ, partial [Candidatus Puniceispirillum sp.]|nr:phosphoribosylformylglycinamidine synthase subunit PurQ [Candidatus Puniceispirillum sp.]